jgi:hypothetical protein
MVQQRIFLSSLGLVALVGAPAFASANTITIQRDTVVSAVFDDTLSVRFSRPGDRFTAHVLADRDLPRGTELEGKIVRIRGPRGDQPPSMDLQFIHLILPNGAAQRIDAVPIALDSKMIQSDDNGRLFVKQDNKPAADVIGGALGGLAIGALIHRPVTGLVIGSVIGMVAANSDQARSDGVVIGKGQKIGALFNRTIDIDLYGRASGRGQGQWGNDRGWDSSGQGSSNSGWDSSSRSGSSNAGGSSSASSSNGGSSAGGWDSHDRDSSGTPPPPPTPASSNPTPPPANNNNANSDRSSTEQNVHLNREVSIRYDVKTLQFDGDAHPYYEGETVMVPLEATAKMLGLTVDHGANNSLYIESDQSSLKLEQDSTSYRLNGKRGTLATAVISRNDVLYGPVAVFGALVQKDLIVNGTKIAALTP